MGALSAEELLGLPVRLHGIVLGRPVDLLLDPVEPRALGFEIRCGDEALRFLAWATVTIREDELEIRSALLLLEDVDFYRTRARSLRGLGPLDDVVVGEDGAVAFSPEPSPTGC
jgi:hypothetical protein